MPDPTNITVTSRATAVPLLSTETVIFKARKSVWPMFISLFTVIVISVALIVVIAIQLKQFGFSRYLEIGIAVVSGFIGLIVVLDWLTTIYTLTNRRVQWRFGIIGEQTKTITLNQVTDSRVLIGIAGRVFNYGDVIVEAAHINSTIVFKTIPSPQTKKELIDSAL